MSFEKCVIENWVSFVWDTVHVVRLWTLCFKPSLTELKLIIRCGSGSGSSCRMSIIRNGNVTLSNLRKAIVTLSNSRKAPVSLSN